MISMLVTREGALHLRNTKAPTFHLKSPLAGVCKEIQVGLKRIVNKLTPIAYRWATEITVDVCNLDFNFLIDSLDKLTQEELDDFEERGTKLTPRLRFGRCPKKLTNKFKVKEEDLESLVEWVNYSTDPREKWRAICNQSCRFAGQESCNNAVSWLKVLDNFAANVEWYEAAWRGDAPSVRASSV